MSTVSRFFLFAILFALVAIVEAAFGEVSLLGGILTILTTFVIFALLYRLIVGTWPIWR